jgi:hypothetical protein
MSVRVMTRVWDAPFPTTSMKLVALKLADCANDDGENIYPSAGRVEKDTGVCLSVVRDVIADLEASGLLVVVTEKDGNQRWRSTTTRRFDLGRLEALGSGLLEWVQIDRAVRDPKTGGEKIDPQTGQPKMRKVWRLTKAATPPAAGGPPLRQPDPTPPAAGPHPSGSRTPPLRQPDPEPSEEPSEEPSSPSLSPTRGRRESSRRWGSAVEELRAEGLHLAVIDELIAPLARTKQPSEAIPEPKAFLADVRDTLARFTPAALRLARQRLAVEWVRDFPNLKACIAMCEQAAPLVRITLEAGDPRWEAWLDYWERHPEGMLISDVGIFRRSRRPFAVDTQWPPGFTPLAEEAA